MTGKRASRRRAELALAALVGAPLAAGLAGRWWVRRSLPRLYGQQTLAGLQAPVEVLRDAWGVPHLYAAHETDLFFAQGFVHAQDRLWQMDFRRRAALGRLAEVAGKAALPTDRLLRRLGLGELARAELDLLDEEERGVLRAYAAGVNAAMPAAPLPPEFGLLRYRPEPWAPEDCLAWMKLLTFSLCMNWDTELVRAQLLARLGPEGTAAVEPPWPSSGCEGAEWRGEDWLETGLRAARPWWQLAAGASNAWAVGGARTASGAPLLAADPHLVAAMPAIWYEVHLTGGRYEVAGASLAGCPGVYLGHNQHLAWGITASMVDVQDLYLEEADPADPTRFRYGEAWERARVETTCFRVRWGADRTEQLLRTRHGPIISPALPGIARPLALRSALLEPGHTLRAMLLVNRAAGWEAFREAVSWAQPALNYVCADRDGQVGYQLGGRIPLRPPGTGVAPLPGATGAAEWEGYIPFAGLPYRVGTADGVIVSANDQPVSGAYPYFLGGEFADDYRARRIRELLEKGSGLTVADLAAVQTDVTSLAASEFLARVLPLLDGQDGPALAALRAWDGSMGTGSAGAALFQVWRRRLLERALSARLGAVPREVLGRGVIPQVPASAYAFRVSSLVRRLLEGRDRAWLGSVYADWADLAASAWRDTEAEVRRGPRADPARWAWGRIHRATLHHPLGRLPGLGRWLNRGPFPLPGDADTILASPLAAEGYDAPGWMPSYRMIADLADFDRCLSVQPGGQSGHPASAHYDDQLALWRRGAYHPLPFSRAAVEAHARHRLTLLPS